MADKFERKHEEQVAYRGLNGDVCADEESNRAHPELCGNEEPIVDREGHALHPHEDVPPDAPQK